MFHIIHQFGKKIKIVLFYWPVKCQVRAILGTHQGLVIWDVYLSLWLVVQALPGDALDLVKNPFLVILGWKRVKLSVAGSVYSQMVVIYKTTN